MCTLLTLTRSAVAYVSGIHSASSVQGKNTLNIVYSFTFLSKPLECMYNSTEVIENSRVIPPSFTGFK